jgi:phenylacetate-CoA ligase
VPLMVWPAIPDQAGAAVLAVCFQLGQTQWLQPGELRRLQLCQAEVLVRHALQTVPFYREHYGRAGYSLRAPLTDEQFAGLPLLARAQIQEAGERIFSTAPPAAHGRVSAGQTSGSTGRPIVYRSTGLTTLLWRAITLRDHDWHRRDYRGRLAAVRWAPDHSASAGWGAATEGIYETGCGTIIKIDTPVHEQLQRLAEFNPDYLLSYASNVAELARASISAGLRLQRLREVRTIAEVVKKDLRELCTEAWGVPLTDLYSAQEVGYIALQCPDHQHYHVQSEGVLVEILRDDGRPCACGETGRVVVTSLHNFAMPLIRYEIGDYATVGAPCPCGRGLPVLERIAGRVRNMLQLPSGERRWPLCDLVKLPGIPGIRQYQYLQKEPGRIEVNLVTGPEYARELEPRLIDTIRERLGYAFAIDFVYRDAIPRTSGGKFEDFVSDLGGGRDR